MYADCNILKIPFLHWYLRDLRKSGLPWGWVSSASSVSSQNYKGEFQFGGCLSRHSSQGRHKSQLLGVQNILLWLLITYWEPALWSQDLTCWLHPRITKRWPRTYSLMLFVHITPPPRNRKSLWKWQLHWDHEEEPPLCAPHRNSSTQLLHLLSNRLTWHYLRWGCTVSMSCQE